MKKIGLIHSAGQNANGTMTPSTERNCAMALDLYRDGKIDHLFIATAEARGDEELGLLMMQWLAGRGVKSRDIDFMPSSHSAREALDKCREWAENCYGYQKFDIIQIDAGFAQRYPQLVTAA